MTREERFKMDMIDEFKLMCKIVGENGRIIANKHRMLKALEQEPRKGQWIKEESIYGWDGYSYQCSECGRSIHLDTEMEDLEDYPYCHCGAKMQEVQ